MTVAIMLLAAVFARPMERIHSVDPLRGRDSYECFAQRLLYETPLEIDYASRPYRLVPYACELPEVSSDGLVYRFRMRSRSVSAADAVRSFERMRDPKNLAANAWIFDPVDRMEVGSDGELVITLKRRCHYFPWLMAMPAAAILDADGGGTGEFELVEWRRNHEMRFRRRARNGAAKGGGNIDEVRYYVVDDMITQWLMFLRGELDFIEDMSRDNFDAITSDPAALERAGAVLYSCPLMQVNMLDFNMTDPVVGANPKLRQALACAFDAAGLIEFNHHRQLEANGVVPPGVAGRIEEPHPYRFDLDRAKRLLAEAGYPGGIDPNTGRRLVLTLSLGRANSESRETGELIASYFERIGVKLELRFMTWDAFMQAINRGTEQLYSISWIGDFPDAQNFLQLFYTGSMRPGPNRSGYSNPEYDREYDSALAAGSEEERNRRWRRCQEILREDCPCIFMSYKKGFMIARKGLGNFIPGDFIFGMERHLVK